MTSSIPNNGSAGDSGKEHGLSTDNRRRKLMHYILAAGAAQVDELMTAFGVSRMTVHRDLDELQRQGVVRKIRGGATAEPSTLFESDFRYRVHQGQREKHAIARHAAHYIEPGQSIFMDESTTVLALTDYLSACLPLTIATNGMSVVDAVREVDGIDLIVLGGNYNRRFYGFFGLYTEQIIASLRINTLFMSASAVVGTISYNQNQQVVKVKRAMMAVAEQRILLLDQHKFSMSALNRLADLREFDRVIVDDGLSEDLKTSLLEQQVKLEIVQLNRESKK
ncbi:MAG: DeoR/GlpR transcriptional regulator [Candidatus Competibacteraceae bacterium]|nr:DeoR/GlpR transcriptional regulator [Candidatus Competibacteraceae bacterium]